MEYICAVCGKKVIGDSMSYIEHNEGHIADAIASKHPDWKDSDGVCRKCLKHYRDELKGTS